jgi:hypothetical protein
MTTSAALRPVTYSVIALLAVVLLTALLAIGCADSGDDGSAASDSDGSTGASQAGDGDGDSSGPGDEESDEPAESDLFALILEDPGERPADLPLGEAQLGGTPLYAAAAAIEKILEDGGVPLDGIEVHVLPVSSTGTALLVLQADLSASASEEETTDDITPALSALVDSDAVRSANVTRVVLNLVGEDEEGAFVVTITMPMDTLPALVDGSLTEEQMNAQMLFGIDRP